MRSDNNRKIKFINKWCVPTIVCISFAILLRTLVIDVYKVPSSSMEPTLLAGDIIVVSKVNYGARIIKLLKLIKKGEIDFYRLPGLNTVKRGDIAVKRCFTAPGHFTIIKNGNKKNDISVSKEEYLFPRYYRSTWSLDDYGPLYVPAHDDSIRLTNVNIQIYKHIILSEDPNIQINDSIVCPDNNKISFYKFKQDYFFVIGDNFSESIDSRYWGFVSDKDIIGKVVAVLCSIDNSKKGLKKIRLHRVFKCDFNIASVQ
jgi:signal peptidase I